MLPNQYLSASQLVGNGAVDYSSAILNEVDENVPEDDFPKGLTFLGKRLEEATYNWELENWGEFEVTYNLTVNDETWSIEGHPDMACIENVNGQRYVVFGEHKFHGVVTDKKRVKAKNQGGFYIAMAYKRVLEKRETVPEDEWNEHSATFPLADYEKDRNPDGDPFDWPLDAEPAGNLVTIVHPRPFERPFEYPSVVIDTREKVQEILDWYETKARQVIKTVQEKDYSHALNWDSGPGASSALNQDPVSGNVDELQDLVDQRNQVKDEMDDLEEEEDKLKRKIKATLHELDEDEIELPDGSVVKRIESKTGRQVKMSVDEAEEMGLDEYVQDSRPYDYVRVY
jgi:hypothetical protein